jgi:hypothetical protein
MNYDIPRYAAHLKGHMTYYGRPCRRGHGQIRYTTSNVCVVCSQARRKLGNGVRRAQWDVDPGDVVRLGAMEAGRNAYLGKVCRYGHSGLRYTRSGSCVLCRKMAREALNQSVKR